LVEQVDAGMLAREGKQAETIVIDLVCVEEQLYLFCIWQRAFHLSRWQEIDRF
jgi:hypothetical protein